jgi:hypothetical protein
MMQRQTTRAASSEPDQEIHNVRETLKTVEPEKDALETQLALLKQKQAEQMATMALQEQEQQRKIQEQHKHIQEKVLDQHDAFLRDKLHGIRMGFQEQTNRIMQLEDEIQNKNYFIDQLQLELTQKLKTIVELEYDLQSHEIHFTEYAEQQYQLGENAMKELQLLQQQQDFMEKQQQECSTTFNSSFTEQSNSLNSSINHCEHDLKKHQLNQQQKNKFQPKRIQALITKLLSDLDHLEELYKQEKLNGLQMKQQYDNDKHELET